MKIDILTLFPDMFKALNESILGKAIEKHLLEVNIVNIRDYSLDKHKKCDDTPFGGGFGMVMTPQPIVDAIRSIDGFENALKIYMSPKGNVLKQSMLSELVKSNDHIILLCGHYEGIDQRVIDKYIDMELSIGDYILMGGELPAMVFVDCLSRYIPNVLGSQFSVVEESFENDLLEYPQYTRPQVFEDSAVPDILISGDHKKIREWRKEQQLIITQKNRPDLLK